MDSILKLFTRCMACAVMATPFCIFSNINVQQVERPLQDVKFDFEKPAADFKQTVDKKVKQAQRKKSVNKYKDQYFLPRLVKGLGVLIFGALAAVALYYGFLITLFVLVFEFWYAPLILIGLGSIFVGGCMVACSCASGAALYRDFKREPEVVSGPTFVSKN